VIDPKAAERRIAVAWCGALLAILIAVLVYLHVGGEP
jgi:high-affinity Fe2+/Pb2+ permease